MNPKQIIKALEPFALLADAFEQDGPEWICHKVYDEQGRLEAGCGKPCKRNVCPTCSPLSGSDVLIDIGGTVKRREVWLRDLQRARSVYNQLKKDEAKHAAK